MTPEELKSHPIFNFRWYHALELMPGVMTAGCRFDNVILTRQLLKGIDVAGMNCLDIGAMDGLVSYLCERRGAKRVVAYDRQSRVADVFTNGDRFRFARESLGSRIDYLWNVPISQIKAESAKLDLPLYDVVVFSGVLYHMFDPMAGLAWVRNLVRDGGLLLIETAALLDPGYALHFNHQGRFYPSTDYWFTTIPILDYLLRFFHLRPIDCRYLHHRDVDGLPVIRAGVLCRAEPYRLQEVGDEWMRLADTQLFDPDFREFLDYESLRSSQGPVPYVPEPATPEIWREDTGSLNVYETMRILKPSPATEHPELLQLNLSDRY
jgi:SAM-dependent methyltransferase